MEVSDGAGLTGALIGTTATRYITARGITPEAGRFTTEIIFIATEERGEHTPLGVECAKTLVHAGVFTIDPAWRQGHSKGIPGRPEDTPRSGERAVCARVRSVAMTTVDRQGALRREAAPASEEGAVAVVVGVAGDATKSGQIC